MDTPMTPLRRFNSQAIWLSLGVVGLAAILYTLALDATMQGYDDAGYIVLAKAIATGKGFRLISSPATLASTTAPGFSMLLAPIWGLHPVFPDGVILFKFASIFFGLLTIPLLFWFLKGRLGIGTAPCLLIVILTATSPVTVYYVSRLVMSEASFIFFSVLALALMAVYFDRAQSEPWGLALTATAIAISYYIRTVGITLLCAGVAYLIWRRQWRRAVILAGIFLLLVLPWWYRNFSLGGLGVAPDIYQNDLLLKDYAHPELGRISSYWDLAPRVFNNAGGHVVQSLPSLLLPALTGDSLRAFLRGLGWDWLLGVIGLLFAALLLVGYVATLRQRISTLEWYVFFYVGMILLPSWVVARNLLPILPFMLYYLYVGLQSVLSNLARLVPPLAPALRHRLAFASLFVLMLVSFLASDRHLLNEGALYRSQGITGAQSGLAQAAAWLNAHATPDAVIAMQMPGLLYLYTERVALGLPDTQTPETALTALQSNRIDYVIVQPDRVPTTYEQGESAVIRELATRRPPGFNLVFAVATSPRTFVFQVDRNK